MWKGRIQNHMSSESKSVERTRKLCFGGAVQTPQHSARHPKVCCCLRVPSTALRACFHVFASAEHEIYISNGIRYRYLAL